MPISATGTSSRGFTLVELLVVLTIVGLMAAAVVLAMPDPRGSLTGDAERFAARAKAAQDRAILDANGMAIRLTPVGYGFDRRADGQWRPLDVKPFADQAWSEGTEAVITGQGATRIVFDPTGAVEPAEILLRRGDQQVRIAIGHDGAIDVAR